MLHSTRLLTCSTFSQDQGGWERGAKLISIHINKIKFFKQVKGLF